tara:strand:- start:2802 stop:3959 length:1158 start_codon:yes stop_codon:yes gene_type:complete
MISYGKQSVNTNDINAVTKALKKSLITQGDTINHFEKLLSKKLKANYCTVVSNGTAALNITANALEWSKKDIIITTPISYISTSNCILNKGAVPYFIDIDPDTYGIDPNRVEDLLKKNSLIRKKIKAIIGVDYAGHPCDWESLKELSKKYKFFLINDNCHSLGSKYNNDLGYASKFADIVTLSFHPVKQITTGEGGAIISNSKLLDEKFKLLRNNGLCKTSKLMKNKGIWFHQFKNLSMNYRMTDFQAALGVSQLNRLTSFVKKRKKIAKIYDLEFGNDTRFKIPMTKKNISHSYHLYPLLINFDNLKITKKIFFKKLLNKKIKLQVHYIPINTQPIYKKINKRTKFNLKNAYNFYKQEVSLPIYYDLKLSQAKKIAKTIKRFLK